MATASEAVVPSSSLETKSDEPTRSITPRVVLLSLCLAILFGYAIPVIDYKLANTFLGATHLPPGALGVLLLLLLVVNPILSLLRRSWRFTRNEVLTVYICGLFASLVPGHGGEGFIVFNILVPFYKATATNHWMDWLQPYLKPWLTPALTADGHINSKVVDGWFTGLNGQPIPWGAWLLPLAFWGVFVLTSYFMLACLCVLLRRQWAENEALTFPLLRLPLELTAGLDNSRGLPPIFSNPSLWLGFGIAVLLRCANGLNFYFPDFPAIPLSLPATQYLSEAPWNQIGFVKVTIIPLAVGVAYLLTTEMSFSLWFFFWFFKFQLVAAYLLGYMPSALPEQGGVVEGKLFAGYQMAGCNIAYVALSLWLAREHLTHIIGRALGRTPAFPSETREVMSYPMAFWGFLGSFAAMIAATCAAGVRVDIAVALWLSYLVIAIGLTRMVVEGGLLFLLYQISPLGIIARLIPGQWLTLSSGLVPASFFQNGMTYHMRGFLMPSFLQSFKLAYDEGIPGRKLGLLIGGVILTSLIVGWSTVVRLGYENGGLQLGQNAFIQGVGSNGMNFIQTTLSGTAGSSPVQNWFWMGLGMAVTAGLVLARGRWLWFPFHPLGYLVGLTYPMQVFWLSIFIAWIIKVLINRMGGSEAVRRATPAFLGLALGDVSMMLFWLAVDGWQGRMAHSLSNG